MNFARFPNILDVPASESAPRWGNPPLEPAPTLPRRALLSLLLGGAAWCLAGGVPKTKAEESAGGEAISLPRAELTTDRVTVEVQVEGELKLNPDGKKVQRVPLRAEGALAYLERRLPEEHPRAARHYTTARAALQVGEAKEESSLSASRRLVIADAAEERPLLFCPLGPFTRAELELLETPFNTLLLDQLLPVGAVRRGGSWKHGDDVLRPLLGLDAVSKSEVQSTLREITRDAGRTLARVELAGTVDGAVGGVATALEVKAKYTYDLEARRITWLSAGIGEDRSIGHAAPGFRLIAKVRVTRQPVEADHPAAAEVAEGALRGIDLAPHGGSRLLLLESRAGRFRLLHDRQWQMMMDRADATILRLVRRGDLIAQCNVSRLPALSDGRELALEEFQTETRRALGENFGQFIQASQSTTDSGLRMLRVVVAGKVSEIPIHWIYYHLSQGEDRAAVVFTVETSLMETFGADDHPLVGSLQFLPETPAARTAEKPE